MAPSKSRKATQISRELDDLVRGICGGFLFGIPLLYTIEVWWIGSSVSPLRLIVALLTTLGVTYLLSRTEGFRKAKATRENDAIGDAVEAIALGIICATLTLILLRQITLDTPFNEALGKIIFESVPFSLGVSLSNQLLQEADDSPVQKESSPLARRTAENALNETIADIGATLIGATIIAFSIAPTDEVTVLVAAIDGPWLVLNVLTSLLLSYGIVFQANFANQKQRRSQTGIFQGPLSETAISYLISLLAAALMLIFFRKLDPSAPFELAFRQVLILGLPATIGGAAGRLAL
ncbi:MAG: TIGR02587 family membrane protein [Phormidesmis priestleyi]|uniref:TIGR02587 family membrane protein n=1 Tax=Phormidesmis priestleyi TaxID=268141 RepID=A0A2W4XJY4_9CYAN|nr:MAG: TIGR02587 family membrane protein [Phormidesmis priestleyi]